MPTFTTRHYRAIADVLTDTGRAPQMRLPFDRPVIAGLFCDYFAADNPRFDRVRFLAACGLKPADVPTVLR